MGNVAAHPCYKKLFSDKLEGTEGFRINKGTTDEIMIEYVCALEINECIGVYSLK